MATRVVFADAFRDQRDARCRGVDHLKSSLALSRFGDSPKGLVARAFGGCEHTRSSRLLARS